MNAALCVVDGCERFSRARGHCKPHYCAAKRRGEFTDQVIRPPASSLIRDDLGRKQCKSCLEWLDEGDFYVKTTSKSASDGLSSECKPCLRARKMGVTAGAILELLKEQKFKCAICRRSFKSGKFDIDHDHTCCSGPKACGRCIRGLLCRQCNVALGNLRDGRDMDLLLRLIQYVDRGRQGRTLDSCYRNGFKR